ncbi:MAG: osmotically-inducible protein OsmY [Gammaproteobacteria bacterium]|jgi:osmotically-inducible protein OsmY
MKIIQTKQIKVILSIALCLSILQGCSSIVSIGTAEPIRENPGKRSMGSFIDDELIEIKAKVNINKTDPELASAHIIITSYNGIVLLAGQVGSEPLRLQAATIAAKIPKVQRVYNELTIAGATSGLARSNDGWITAKIKSKMMSTSTIPANRIKVVTENGIVYLMGLLTQDEGDRAAELARTTSGVQKVVRIFEYI